MRTDGAMMDEIGDEAVAVFTQQASDVELVTRRDHCSPLGMTDVHDRERRVLVKVVLSTTYGQLENYLPELQEFVDSLRPEQPEKSRAPE